MLEKLQNVKLHDTGKPIFLKMFKKFLLTIRTRLKFQNLQTFLHRFSLIFLFLSIENYKLNPPETSEFARRHQQNLMRKINFETFGYEKSWAKCNENEAENFLNLVNKCYVLSSSEVFFRLSQQKEDTNNVELSRKQQMWNFRRGIVRRMPFYFSLFWQVSVKFLALMKLSVCASKMHSSPYRFKTCCWS